MTAPRIWWSPSGFLENALVWLSKGIQRLYKFCFISKFGIIFLKSLNLMVLAKTLKFLGCKEIKLVNPKGNQQWIFIGRTDGEAEVPILWPLDMKSQLIKKDPGAGKDWGQEKGVTEDEMVGWHHQLNGHEFEQTLGNNEGQGSLACCSPQGPKESDMT